MLDVLQKLNKDMGFDRVYIIRIGMFFVGLDIDAFILENVLKLKKTKFSKDVFKVGFPCNSLNKYINILKEKGISFWVLDYVKEKNMLAEYITIEDKEYEIITKFEGKKREFSKYINFKDRDRILESLFNLKFLNYTLLCYKEQMEKIKYE